MPSWGACSAEVAHRLWEAGLSPNGLRLVAEGLVGISEGNALFTFVVGKGYRKGMALKQLPLTETWGGEHVHRCQASHATFGNVVVVIFADGEQTRSLIVAGRPLRGQLLRLAQRYAVMWPCIQEHFHHLTVGKAGV